MILSLMRRRAVPLLAAAALAACTGREKPAYTDDHDSTTMSAEAFQARKAFIDSVVNHAPKMESIVKELSPKYDQADSALALAVRREAEKTRDCYTQVGFSYDPTLTGVAYVVVHFGAVGWDLIRVERAQWSSPAGNAVAACINNRAKTEWKLPMTGVKPGAHLVQLTFRPDSVRRE
jgi:hypothetical protein